MCTGKKDRHALGLDRGRRLGLGLGLGLGLRLRLGLRLQHLLLFLLRLLLHLLRSNTCSFSFGGVATTCLGPRNERWC